MEIPEKLTFKRNEVIRLTRLEGRVLDYWQKEFGVFDPTVNQVGEKFYTRDDVELILKIKQWMVVERIEKEKVKERIKQEYGPTPGAAKANTQAQAQTHTHADEKIRVRPSGPEVRPVLPDSREKLRIIRQNLQEILTILDKNGK